MKIIIKKHNPRANLGELNGQWKGKDVGYRSLHEWVNNHKPKPKNGLCEFCKVKKFKDLANLTGILDREFHNWVYLCATCHINYDRRELKEEIQKRNCLICKGKTLTRVNSKGTIVFQWFRYKDGFVCVRCYKRGCFPKVKQIHKRDPKTGRFVTNEV